MSDIEDSDDLFNWAEQSSYKQRSVERSRGPKYTFADTLFQGTAAAEEPGRSSLRIFLPLLIFGAGMAFLESAVVVYLRELWGTGDLFPIKDLFEHAQHLKTFRIEYAREAATLVMLVSIAWALGRNIWQRMAYLIFLFGVWDIFYYVWLWVTIGWPSSPLTWDVLFFIPVLLVSPVYAPVAVSVVMIFCGMMIIHAQRKHVTLKSSGRFWVMELLAFALVYTSFIWEPVIGTLKTNPAAVESELEYPWLMFVIGLTVGLTAFLFLIGNCFKSRRFDMDLYVSRKI